MENTRADTEQALERLTQRVDDACERLARTAHFAKFTHSAQVLESVRRLMTHPQGVPAAYERIGALTDAGIFSGSDWEHPEHLQPALSANTLKLAQDHTLILECLSELRLVAIANGTITNPTVDADAAQQFLARVLALNLRLIFGPVSEAERVHLGRNLGMVQRHQRFIAEQVGFGEVIEELIGEIWRILAQRPVVVDHVKQMITSVAVYLDSDEPGVPAARARGAERLISALYGPTRGCQEDPGLAVYRERLASMDETTLRNEALGFGRAMHDTGLVSPYHPVFLHFALDQAPELLPAALGLSSTGVDALGCYPELVHTLIRRAIWSETAQAVYGLAGLLERGILYSGPVAPALWRQIHLPLSAAARRRLTERIPGAANAPEAFLLAGAINVLGQPRGLGQGNSPTCQSARALSMWSSNDPDYLLQIVAWSARDDDVVAHFEGEALSSQALLARYPEASLEDVDAVSAVAVPHLDAIYHEMGRRCVGRGEDPHRWVNPEFHGWWVGRGFSIAVDVATGSLPDLASFARRFYGCYHPSYNGNNPVIHPQPAGVAVTNATAAFVGWHAITIERVSMDPEGVVRVYFFNPNNDSTQDWGDGVTVSTEGNGERHGESSLPFAQFLSRLYIFHYDPREEAVDPPVPVEAISEVIGRARTSWAAGREIH
ncbi:hypothetical protein [Halorhodospira halophila]|uniref:Uncharacterized protein n=1 Tax=Halorhodospira halophila (strain DSM 244 / SL1) TaxID=349124 RepID=A1WX45_HALHL|nr:hypothetical protein [Halorhodospira halophila]ABM62257.1 conserved hypothetical protein [Halorhodospira halophila SL1]MBK1729232.1 hypothetical protein [Halorhodospira halophila]